jgi:hypothetical protein
VPCRDPVDPCPGQRLAELDVNPIFVKPDGHGVVAADALIMLS